MNWRRVTLYFIMVLVLVAVGYDIFVIAHAGKAASISQIIIELSHEYPSVTFAAGFVCGHLFWRMRDPKELQK